MGFLKIRLGDARVSEIRTWFDFPACKLKDLALEVCKDLNLMKTAGHLWQQRAKKKPSVGFQMHLSQCFQIYYSNSLNHVAICNAWRLTLPNWYRKVQALRNLCCEISPTARPLVSCLRHQANKKRPQREVLKHQLSETSIIAKPS